MNKPLVSICCITFNQKAYIKDCIDGFLMQKTNFNFEILIHDDASTDGTQEIISEYELKYPNLIKAILQLENQYSKGIKPLVKYIFPIAQGKYIALCEGDDYWTDPFKLQKQVNYLEQNPNCAGCFHPTQLIYEETNLPGKIYGIDTRDEIFDYDTIVSLAPFHTSSFVFRTSALDYPVWFHMVSSGDIALFSIVAKSGYLKKTDGVMSIYRKNKSGLSFTKFHNELYHQKRIELAVLLNHYHDYKYSQKAMEVIDFHLKELNKNKEKPFLNLKNTWVFKILRKIKKQIVP